MIKEKVLKYLENIPCGKVVTYAQIGEYLGNRHLCRAIGNILHNNPDGNRYPCYRVVNFEGRLSDNYAFGGIEAQNYANGFSLCHQILGKAVHGRNPHAAAQQHGAVTGKG